MSHKRHKTEPQKAQNKAVGLPLPGIDFVPFVALVPLVIKER